MSAYNEKWELPPIPLTPVDMVNRAFLAQGSMRNAMIGADSNYNGHAVTISHKPHAMSGPIWNAEYFWAGRRVIGRGGFARCVEAAVREYQRGARGTTVRAYISDDDSQVTPCQQRRILEDAGFVKLADDWNPQDKPAYWTIQHTAAIDAFHWSKWGHQDMIAFALAFEGETKEEWEAARKEFLDNKRSAA